MSDIELHNKQYNKDAISSDTYSPSLKPLLQSLLSTLADIDFAYEQEREKISMLSPDPNLKIRVLEKLKAQHRERREPYIRQLASLQERAMPLHPT